MHVTRMDRPFWTEPENERIKDVTVLICQNHTPDLIRLCIESLLTFYPTINIFVVNSTEEDESTTYLRYKEVRHENIKVWAREGDNSHGGSMHDAIVDHITSKYVLTLDSDTITKRGGWIELMVDKIIDNVFAIGTLNLTTRSNDAVGNPINDEDILKYAHPSCSIYDRDIYLTLSADREIVSDANDVMCRPQFCNHGSPCWSMMKAAEIKGYEVLGFPIENYVMHLSGASYTEPRTVWDNDFGVFVRPFVTFITNGFYVWQTDSDFDIVQLSDPKIGDFVSFNKDSSNVLPLKVNNRLFKNRLRITGDYVCVIPDDTTTMPISLVEELRQEIIKWPDRLSIEIDGFTFYTREYYQSKIAWK